MKRTRSCDPVGQVSIRENDVIRKISPLYVEAENEILDSTVVQFLLSKGVIPQTTKLVQNGDCFLVHEKIHYYSLPHEWTFDMLKDAILATLEIDHLLEKAGFGIKDFHFGNVMIAGSKIIFVDFGSIVGKKCGGVPEYLHEFIKYCFMPLYLWSEGDGYFATRILADEIHDNRFFGINYKKHLPVIIKVYLMVDKIRRLLKKKLNIELRAVSEVAFLKNQVKHLKEQRVQSVWGNYHVDFFSHLESQESYPRFKHLCEVVRSFAPKTVLDLAGNAGVFSLICSQTLTNVQNIYCCDCDHNAINFLYNFLKKSERPEHRIITPIMMNIAFPSAPDLFGSYERLKSDVVCLLAATHHLFLSQGIDADYLFSEVKRYVKHAVIIEFMPLGLFDGDGAPPLPDWYNRGWFKEKFSQHFSLVAEYDLEANRVAFVGLVEEG